MDLIADRSTAPDMAAIESYIRAEERPLWQELTAHIQNAYGARPQLAYSTCMAKPGWNVKYKKSGKALCTLYPEPDGFTALVVLGAADMVLFETVRPAYTAFLNQLYDSVRLMNGTKWLMIRVSEQDVLGDIKKLLALKTAKA